MRIAIVLLGLEISVADILSIGSAGLSAAVIAAATTLAVPLAAGRVLGVERNSAILIAAGTGICGVAAMGSAIRASARDMTYVILCVTLFGLISMFLFPIAGKFLGLDARLFGIWTGAAVHEVAQVVAAGFQHSRTAGEVATITKLSRVVLLAPVVAVIAFSLPSGTGAPRAKSVVPWFVIGFALAVAANSSLTVPGETRALLGILVSALFYLRACRHRSNDQFAAASCRKRKGPIAGVDRNPMDNSNSFGGNFALRNGISRRNTC